MSTDTVKTVSGVNNFITDLLDIMEQMDADSLVIPVGYDPVFYRGNQSFRRRDETIDKEELREDLDALGLGHFSLPVTFIYKPEGGSFEEITFTVHSKIASTYTGVNFRIIDQKER